VSNGRAIRVAARESSKQRARELYPNLEKNPAQMKAYRELPDQELFDIQWVSVDLPEHERPGFKGERIACARCGEGISFRREVVRDGQTLCKACAGEQYWKPAPDPGA
jgi:formylmethanofuran dehydrogenase subunit E